MQKRVKIIVISLLILLGVFGYGLLNQVGDDTKSDFAQGIVSENEITTVKSETQITTANQDVTIQPTTTQEVTTEVPTTEAPTTKKQESIRVNLKMVGDMLLHSPLQETGLMEDGNYNYDHLFTNILNDINSADVAIVNQEVLIGGNDIGIKSYPCFNCLTQVGDAIVKAGFDVVLHATNHTMDQGQSAVDHCIDFWRNTYPQIACLGMNKTAEDTENIYVYEKDGLKIAMLNYTYGLNGISLPSDRPYLVNMLTGSNEDNIRSDIAKAKELSDFVIVFPHWGTEYVYEPDSNQKYWTEVFAECGVDLVIGAHPHVIEPVEWVDRADGGKMLVYYSLGNYISDQKEAPRMLGAMAEVAIEKDENGVVSIVDYGVVPLVTHEVHHSTAFTTYKLKDYTEELAAQNYILERDDSFSIQMMKDLCRQVFGELYIE